MLVLAKLLVKVRVRPLVGFATRLNVLLGHNGTGPPGLERLLTTHETVADPVEAVVTLKPQLVFGDELLRLKLQFCCTLLVAAPTVLLTVEAIAVVVPAGYE